MTKMTTTEIWNAPLPDLYARLDWLSNEAPLDSKEHDAEYWDIIATIITRGDED